MAKLQDFESTTQANLTALTSKLTDIQNGITNLDTLITTLQNTPDLVTAADQALLDQIQAQSTALVTQAGAISTDAPPATPPPAPPAA